MSSSKKIVSGFFWNTIANIVNALYGFFSIPILINHYGKDEYGLIGLAMSVNIYLNLMDMGLNSTNVRFYSNWLSNRDYNRLQRGFKTSLSFYSIIGLINLIVLLIVAFFSNKIFNVTYEQNEILQNLFIILSIFALGQWLSSCFDQLIRASEEIAWIQKRTLITKILMVIVLIMTVYCDFKIEVYYFLTCLATFSIVPLSISKIKKEIPYAKFNWGWDKAAFKEMLPYCMNIFSFAIFEFSFYNLRPLFLGIQGTIESVADFRILNGIVGLITLISGPFCGILLPSTSKIVAKNDLNAFYKVAYDGTRYISILICFCCFGMMTVGKEVLTIYVGESYLYLIPWLNIWILCILGKHNQAISSLILAGNDIRSISYSTATASIIGLISSWFLIPSYNIGGISIAFVIYMTIQLSFYYLYYWPQKMSIDSKRVFFKSFFPYVILGSILYFLITFIINIETSTITMLLIKGLLFTSLYFILILIMLGKEERDKIINLIK